MLRHDNYLGFRQCNRRLILQVDSGLIYTNFLRGMELALVVDLMFVCKSEDSRTHADSRRMSLTVSSASWWASACKLTHAYAKSTEYEQRWIRRGNLALTFLYSCILLSRICKLTHVQCTEYEKW